jgi:hypothetical protein
MCPDRTVTYVPDCTGGTRRVSGGRVRWGVDDVLLFTNIAHHNEPKQRSPAC